MTSLAPTGPILGPIPGGWQTGEVHLLEGDKLVVFTDGLTEAHDEGPRVLRRARLVQLVSSLKCPEAQPMVDAILDDLDRFQPARLADDVTLIVVCRGSRVAAQGAPDDTMSAEVDAFGVPTEGVTTAHPIDERRSTMSGS